MEPTKFWIKTQKKKDLFAWFVTPASTPKAVVILVHGYGEHSWRYLGWAEKFVNAGYAFLSWDHQGHGLSDGQRGHIPSYSYFLDEVDLTIDKAAEFFPNVPIVLYGHSMGGNIAINYALSNRKSIKYLIATSPWLRLAKPASLLVNSILGIFRALLPMMPFMAPVKPNDTSKIPDAVERYKTDPLIHNRLTPSLYFSIKNAGEYAIANGSKLTMPFLLMHGDADRITSCQASEQLSQSCSNVEFVKWPNQYHEMHNDTASNELFLKIEQWLDEKIGV